MTKKSSSKKDKIGQSSKSKSKSKSSGSSVATATKGMERTNRTAITTPTFLDEEVGEEETNWMSTAPSFFRPNNNNNNNSSDDDDEEQKPIVFENAFEEFDMPFPSAASNDNGGTKKDKKKKNKNKTKKKSSKVGIHDDNNGNNDDDEAVAFNVAFQNFGKKSKEKALKGDDVDVENQAVMTIARRKQQYRYDDDDKKGTEEMEEQEEDLWELFQAWCKYHSQTIKYYGFMALIVLFIIICITLIVTITKKNNESNMGSNGNKRRSEDRTEEVIQFLLSKYVSEERDLRQYDTPQRLAVEFLGKFDTYDQVHMHNPDDNGGGDSDSYLRFIERYVVTVLYFHFTGREWTYQLNFLDPTLDVCNWYSRFYTKSGNSLREGILCNTDDTGGGNTDEKDNKNNKQHSNGYVTKIILPYNNLKGNGVPDEIKWLRYLDTFHVYFNEGITNNNNGEGKDSDNKKTTADALPMAFRYMPKLQTIGMHFCSLQGTIPTWIGEMTNLSTLSLSNNNLRGRLPGESFQRLTNLKYLALDDNVPGFEGNIQEVFGTMTKLQHLYLEDNMFTGQFHPTNYDVSNTMNKKDLVRDVWTELIELDVSNNQLSGTIPDSIVNHRNLTIVDVHSNVLSGTFPNNIFENTNLKLLAVHSNQLIGTIPDRIGFLHSLSHLDVSYNKLTGIVPNTMSAMTHLQYLALSNNPLRPQPIPEFIYTNLIKLQDLLLKGNNFVGTIPQEIGTNLQQLVYLDLDHNQLTGSIPTTLGSLSNTLRYLFLNRNKLTGNIPTQIGTLSKLQYLLLDQNSISGNADVICRNEDVNPTIFIADCYPGRETQPEIICNCCTKCCVDTNLECNNVDWTANLDPIYEYKYQRQRSSSSSGGGGGENDENENVIYRFNGIDDIDEDTGGGTAGGDSMGGSVGGGV